MPSNAADKFVRSFKKWLDDPRVAGDTRYLEYINEPHSGDEADVVDMRFATVPLTSSQGNRYRSSHTASRQRIESGKTQSLTLRNLG